MKSKLSVVSQTLLVSKACDVRRVARRRRAHPPVLDCCCWRCPQGNAVVQASADSLLISLDHNKTVRARPPLGRSGHAQHVSPAREQTKTVTPNIRAKGVDLTRGHLLVWNYKRAEAFALQSGALRRSA
jgi:hypothetical protein